MHGNNVNKKEIAKKIDDNHYYHLCCYSSDPACEDKGLEEAFNLH